MSYSISYYNNYPIYSKIYANEVDTDNINCDTINANTGNIINLTSNDGTFNNLQVNNNITTSEIYFNDRNYTNNKTLNIIDVIYEFEELYAYKSLIDKTFESDEQFYKIIDTDGSEIRNFDKNFRIVALVKLHRKGGNKVFRICLCALAHGHNPARLGIVCYNMLII